MTEGAGEPQPGEPELRVFAVHSHKHMMANVRAHDEEEARDFVNFDLSAHDYENAEDGGIDIEETDGEPDFDVTTYTAEPEKPRELYAVQFSAGGIPQDPHLVVGYENALRFFAEVAVANNLEWTGDCSGEWVGNDDDEVRLFGPLGTFSTLAPPTVSEWTEAAYVERPFNAEENAAVAAILAAIRERNKADREAREAVAELNTPGGGCD
ncbi:MAG TPA: hypothetical protein VMG99_08845 [Thermoplasmata archaeon]|nr:hypothetical protein [Thermoplasmata archaeon]